MNLPEGRIQVQCGGKLDIAKIPEALVYALHWISVLYGHSAQVARVATDSQLSFFLFGYDEPQAQSDFEESIMSYSSSISISARHTYNL